MSTKRLDYGLDAPGLMLMFALTGLAFSLAAGLLSTVISSVTLLIGLPIGLAIFACYCLGMSLLMVTWSLVIKVRRREATLDWITWRGDEHVLDVGCGRGLMLVAAARRLTAGKAVGIDIWRAEDQSGNSPAAALENASIEGVADRIEIETADMRDLPFPDGRFDVVVSHWVVHNLDLAADRSRALSEMRRVLRPGGQLILADIAFAEAYLVELAQLGFEDCRLVVKPVQDVILRAISFGSFRPSVIYAWRGN